MSLDRYVPEVPRERPEGDAVGAERARDHRARDLEDGSERTEIGGVLGVLDRPAHETKRTLPPLDVVIAGDDQQRKLRPQPAEEKVGRLEFPVPRPLGQVPGHHHRAGAEGGDKIFESLDLREVDIAAEVQIGEVDDGDA